MLPEAPAHGARDSLMKAGWVEGSPRTVSGAGAPGSRGWWAQPQGSELQPTAPDHGSPEAPGCLQGPAGERTCPLVLSLPGRWAGRLARRQGGALRPVTLRRRRGPWGGPGRCGFQPCQPVLGRYQAGGGTVPHWMARPEGRAWGSRDPRGLSVTTACPQTPPRAAPYPAAEADGPGGGPAAPPAGHPPPLGPGRRG